MPHLFKVICALLLAIANNSQAIDDLYQAALKKFKEGEYTSALTLFRAHQASGAESPTLTYNIAVCHYKLGQYAQAHQEFSRLTTDPRWQHLARYNLGIIAEKQMDFSSALAWYRQVQQLANDEKLQQMASRKLEAITGSKPDQHRSRWAVSGGTGYDTNPYGFNDTVKPTNAGDPFMDLLLYGRQKVKDDLALTALMFSRRYEDFDTINTDMVELGVQYQGNKMRLGYSRHGIYATLLTLEGNTYSQEARGQLGFDYHFSNAYLYWRYEAALVDGGEDYRYLDGHRQRTRIEWVTLGNVPSLSVYYQFGIDDHEDLLTDTYSIIQSKTAHQTAARVSWPFHLNWEASAAFTYTHKQYDGETRLTDLDGEFRTGERKTDTQSLEIGLSRILSPAWRVSTFLELEHTHDNFELYSYDRMSLELELTYQNR